MKEKRQYEKESMKEFAKKISEQFNIKFMEIIKEKNWNHTTTISVYGISSKWEEPRFIFDLDLAEEEYYNDPLIEGKVFAEMSIHDKNGWLAEYRVTRGR